MRPVVTAVLPSVTALGEREGPASSPVTAAGVSAQLVPAGSSAPSVPLVPSSQTDISPSRVEISHIQFYLGKTFGLAVCQPPATAMPAAKGTVIPLSRTGLGQLAWPCGHRDTGLDARTLHYSFVSPAPRIVSDVR